jgi:hypothetical protein
VSCLGSLSILKENNNGYRDCVQYHGASCLFFNVFHLYIYIYIY